MACDLLFGLDHHLPSDFVSKEVFGGTGECVGLSGHSLSAFVKVIGN